MGRGRNGAAGKTRLSPLTESTRPQLAEILWSVVTYLEMKAKPTAPFTNPQVEGAFTQLG